MFHARGDAVRLHVMLVQPSEGVARGLQISLLAGREIEQGGKVQGFVGDYSMSAGKLVVKPLLNGRC